MTVDYILTGMATIASLYFISFPTQRYWYQKASLFIICPTTSDSLIFGGLCQLKKKRLPNDTKRSGASGSLEICQ